MNSTSKDLAAGRRAAHEGPRHTLRDARIEIAGKQTTYVDFDNFCELLVSRKELTYAGEREGRGSRALYERATGTRYVLRPPAEHAH